MAKVTISFDGAHGAEAAQKLYTWIIDGGLQDGILDECSGDDYDLDTSNWDNETLTIGFSSIPKDSA